MALKVAPSRVATVGSRLKPPPKTVAPLYRSPEWKALIASIKRERGNRCEECGKPHRIIIGDHVIELKDGGAPLDPSNIRLMCLPCHNTKTAKARAARR